MTRRLILCVTLLLISATACAGASKTELEKVALPETAMLATFGGGCFWCMEPPFEKLDGVYAVTSGYSGGEEINPSYNDVAGGRTGHTEVVQVAFDPKRVSYDKLLDVFWRSMDPTDSGGQFADRGTQYRPAIFTHGAKQREAALKSRAALGKSGVFSSPIVVEITPFRAFYAAEEYHQDYYKKNPRRYESYRRGSGRAAFLERIWGKAK